jgi:hypothetical protein
VDVWDDVCQQPGVEVEYGIRGNGPLDRVAGTGRMTFQLRNDDGNSAALAGYYSPGHANCMSGFGPGIPARLAVTYDSRTYYKFYGRISRDGITALPGVYGKRRTEVTVLDWMEQAAIHKLYLPTLATSKRIDEVVPLVVANMPIAPLATEYNEGGSTFDWVFDTVRGDQTTAIGEFNKLAMSELGWIYVKRDQTGGETLTVDGRFTRTEREVQNLPVPGALATAILDTDEVEITDEAGETLISEDDVFAAGVGIPVSGSVDTGEWLTDETGEPLFDEDSGEIDPDEIGIVGMRCPIVDMSVAYGKHLYNKIKYTVYPRYVDSTASTVLFSLNSYITLAPGETRTNVLGRYRDPNGGASRISGKDMVTPAATTDYLMNSASDGSGTNLTANLTVTANYGTEGVNYTLQNTHATSTGYVTKLQARGKGIYTYDPVTMFLEDTTSEDANGTLELGLDFKYEQRVDIADLFADVHLAAYSNPTTTVEDVTYIANYDAYALITWLELEPGMRFEMYEEQTAIGGTWILSGVNFSITGGNLIRVTYMPALGLYDMYVLWEMGIVGMSELGETTIVSYEV